MSTNDTRVNYYEGQFLRTQDFVDEQSYHTGNQQGHAVGSHFWGIVRGLEVVAGEGGVFLQPGYAVDGFGRVLIVSERRVIPIRAFTDKNSDVLDVSLLYDRTVRVGSLANGAECADVSAEGSDRVDERPTIQLDVAAIGSDPRQPPGVPEQDLDFGPSRDLPVGVKRRWPVFLARIERDPTAENTFTVDMSGRPYAGLVGEGIVAPSGRAWVEIGSELTARPAGSPCPPSSPIRRRLCVKADGDRRFAVFVPEAETDPNAAIEPRLEITKTGEVRLRGDTTIDGDLTIDGGAIEWVQGSDPANPPARDPARPWRIYHAAGQVSSGDDELRIEMGKSGTGSNRVVIGAWSDDKGKFVPCLTVKDTCSVEVHGDLFVEGILSAAGGCVEGPPSGEVKDLIAAGLFSVVLGATIGTAPTGSTIATFLADALLDDPNLLTELISVLNTDWDENGPSPPKGGKYNDIRGTLKSAALQIKKV